MQAAKTQEGRYVYGDDEPPIPDASGSIDRLPIGPGQQLKDQSCISDIYDMTASGTYTIYVERNVPAQDDFSQTNIVDRTKDVIKSNVISIQVLP
jgi:hypothetical protein